MVLFWLHCSVARRGAVALLHLEKYLLVSLTLTGLVCAVLYAPPVLISGWSTVTRPMNWAVSGPVWLLGATGYEIYHAVRDWIRDVPLFFTLTLLAGFLVSLFQSGERGDRHRALTVSLLASCAALLSLTHLVPPGRGWLWALPFYLMGASYGLVSLIGKIMRGKNATRLAVALSAAAVLGGLTLKNVNSDTILRTQETEGLRDAERITNLLLARKVPLDRIIVQCAPIIEYYLYVRENRRVKLGFDAPDGDGPYTVWLVVNHGWDNTVSRMLGKQKLLAKRVVSVDRFDAAAVYQILVRPAPSVQK